MTTVLLGLGTNVNRQHHVGRGLDALEQLLGPLQISPVFESDAVGVLGHRFFNLVVAAETHLPLADLGASLKAIEAACGRRDQPCAGRITLDIDILTYADLTGMHDGVLLPRPETLRNAFVLWPLALLVPHSRPPGAERSYAQLWADWEGQQRLWPVACTWRGRELTSATLITAHRPRAAL